MKKVLKRILFIALLVYLLTLGFFYSFQEIILFHPEKIDKNYTFKFNQKFEEINIKSRDSIQLNGLLFRADNSRGLIFYLHGNAGTLDSWGHIARYYTVLGYDVLMMDYRGFGKSDGHITSEAQLYEDTQAWYDYIKQRYSEDNIVVLGYSIGTGLATKLSASNNPKMLILQAPYYNMSYLIHSFCPIMPNALIRYKLETDKNIVKCTMPIVIYHGDKDFTISHENSVKLQRLIKPLDKCITLQGQVHSGITENKEYQQSIKEILLP